MQRRDVIDADIRVAGQLAAEFHRQLAQCNTHGART